MKAKTWGQCTNKKQQSQTKQNKHQLSSPNNTNNNNKHPTKNPPKQQQLSKRHIINQNERSVPFILFSLFSSFLLFLKNPISFLTGQPLVIPRRAVIVGLIVIHFGSGHGIAVEINQLVLVLDSVGIAIAPVRDIASSAWGYHAYSAEQAQPLPFAVTHNAAASNAVANQRMQRG